MVWLVKEVFKGNFTSISMENEVNAWRLIHLQCDKTLVGYPTHFKEDVKIL
jgi:hypothetical protein